MVRRPVDKPWAGGNMATASPMTRLQYGDMGAQVCTHREQFKTRPNDESVRTKKMLCNSGRCRNPFFVYEIAADGMSNDATLRLGVLPRSDKILFLGSLIFMILVSLL